MKRCLAYRQVIPWEKRCMKKEEETGVKPSYCLYDGDIEKCRIVESVLSNNDEQLCLDDILEAIVDNKKLKECSCGGVPELVIDIKYPPLYMIKCGKCGKATGIHEIYPLAKDEWENWCTKVRRIKDVTLHSVQLVPDPIDRNCIINDRKSLGWGE